MNLEDPSIEYLDLFKEEKSCKANPFQVLLRLYHGHWVKLIISLLFYIIKSAPVWVFPIVTANVINIATKPDSHSDSELWMNFMIIFIVYIQNIPMHTFHVAFFSKALRQVEAGLRSTLVRKLQQLSMGYYGNLGAGRIQTKVLRDVEAIEMSSRQLMLGLMPAMINLTIAVVLTVMHSITVALFFVLTVPTSLVIIYLFRKKIAKTNREFRTRIEEMSGSVSQMVEMIPVTRAHGLEEFEIKKMDKRLKNIKEKGFQLDILEGYFASSNWVTFQVFQVLCLFFTAYLAYKGEMPVGDVVMYQGFFNMILGAVTNILNVYPIIVKGFESIYSVTEILMSEDTENLKGRRFPERITGNISFKDVSFQYPNSDKHALKSFSLEVNAGETVAFVGESGSGKSTILNLIIGFYKAQQGTILIDGISINDISIRKYRKYLAMVLQNNILFSGTIRDNITYGLPDVREEILKKVIKMANLQDVIENLSDGLDTRVGEHGSRLSGGQRQRIAIARALIRDPKIIILDEATSALDNKSERYVQQAMEKLTRDRTTFVVAHRLSTVRHADKIVVMEKGEVIEMGTYEELLTKRGAFYELQHCT
ncbi:ATP-binding cassette subfamily B protein [Bacillus sp. SLBN-46]|jgi:ATP-binding cassette, subfamily B, bacterial|uniref:ABC transporter ATP-binding protein n=1 Tax=Bacillus sp. SLBN-46 TaxID=3042283 RepID=UPI00285CC9E4|nr:ABC transporter ATP-binding protein [Bacillus sp. SLBN-46]MDR6125111.1 ATP-binding cassette subfamily B protein [Bacillus sp. SLBN-46]